MSASPNPNAKKMVRIVLAETGSIHRAHFENVVAHSRYEIVAICQTVDEVFTAYRNLTPDVLVLDVLLAGQKVVSTLRKGFPGIRIVIGYEPLHADRVLPALAQGALDAVKKPFDGADLFDALFHAVEVTPGSFDETKRRTGRIRLELPVEFRGAAAGLFSRGVQGKLGDLSSDGLCLRTDRELEPGEKVRLRIHLGEDLGEIHLKARVVNRREMPGSPLREYGLEFRDLADRVKKRIESFLLEHLSGMPE